MKRLLAVLALLLLATACSTAHEEPPDHPGVEDDFFEEPEAVPQPQVPEAENPVSDTDTGTARQEPPPPAPEAPTEPEPQEPSEVVDDGVPSIEIQIQQCTEQTGMPDECRGKIQDGIVE